ncbi:MAG TPA: DUF3703 domain-containing protein [Cytophagaceae bacterium]
MRVYTKIPQDLKVYYNQELDAFHSAFVRKDLQVAWRHLERAHILGQSYPYEHTEVHLKMLKFGASIKNWHEVFGQIPRLLIGGVKSFVGRIPVGNTGGANVPPLRPMEIPDDLNNILDRFRK